ncbi:hypothetical protein F5Y02DRAFT_128350 [Annulohypoxylon stygium]|nr:hypothetical protein F5Y02DRAFT_128350 [Annulohypoxylon stygium]
MRELYLLVPPPLTQGFPFYVCWQPSVLVKVIVCGIKGVRWRDWGGYSSYIAPRVLSFGHRILSSVHVLNFPTSFHGVLCDVRYPMNHTCYYPAFLVNTLANPGVLSGRAFSKSVRQLLYCLFFPVSGIILGLGLFSDLLHIENTRFKDLN